MTELLHRFTGLKRPSLMIRAARLGAGHYRRDRDLARVLKGESSTGKGVFAALLDAEAGTEAIRRAGDATYNITRHIDLLIALLAEARLMQLQPK